MATVDADFFEIVEAEVQGAPMRVFKNAPPSLRAIWDLSALHGDAPYLVYEGRRWSYAEAHDRVAAVAAHLVGLGVGKGDRVAIAMRNLPEWALAFWAASSLGAVIVPLNAWWTGPELEYGLTDSGTKIAVMDAERYQRLTEHFANCPDLKRVYVSREAEEIAHPYVAKLESVLGGPNDWAKLPDQAPPAIATDGAANRSAAATTCVTAPSAIPSWSTAAWSTRSPRHTAARASACAISRPSTRPALR